jgi:hypothetical protein
MFRYLGWRTSCSCPRCSSSPFSSPDCFVPGLYFALLNGLIIKAIIIAVALPVAQIAWAVRAGAAARKEPFCIHCGQCLTGLPAIHICPECGRPYDLAVLNDYRRDPAWFIQRWRARRDIPQPAPSSRPPRRNTSQESRDGT